MLRTVLLSLLLFVSLSSTSLLRKSISRRQSESEQCNAIEGFNCKCSTYRLTCTSDRVLPSQISILPNERQKHSSIELIISGAHEQNVYEYTFEPVKYLYKPDADTLEFRIKFETFTALQLASGVFNRIFPDNLPSNARKYVALEIYNAAVQPNDNVNLFANLNVDSLELYVVYPFRGTFQQLFNGANIKYLRLSGGDIRSDLSQPFTGNIGRLELVKQAPKLTTETLPIYPAHELIINAYYVSDFNSDNPPNYSNLGELRIHTDKSIPANAFRQYQKLHTLSITTDKDIDPHAFDGLYNLEKLTIKDTKPSLQFLTSLPNIKEYEVSLEKLNDQEQCQLVEKVTNGQVAVQAAPNARDCTCAAAYLNSAAGSYACDAQNCDKSSCAAIKNNYEASTRTFKAPPPIKRADGSNALHQREPKVYTSPYQISNQDREKLQQDASQQSPGQEGEEQQSEGVTQAGQTKKPRRTKPRIQGSTLSYDQQNAGEQGQWQPEDPNSHHQENQPSSNFGTENERHSSVVQNESQQKDSTNSDKRENERSEVPWDYVEDYEADIENNNDDPNASEGETDQGEDGEAGTQTEGGENQQDGEGTGNQQGEHAHGHHSQSDPNQSAGAVGDDATGGSPPAKKGFNWLLIIIIAASVAALLLIGLIVLIIRKRRARGYNPAATSETAPTRA